MPPGNGGGMPQAKSPHHAIAWKRRPDFRANEPINKLLAWIRAAQENPECAYGRDLAALVPVFRADGQARRRRTRNDGFTNFLSHLAAVIGAADAMTGFVGRPARMGGPWDRKTLEDLDGLAYGQPIAGERSLRRTERHARAMKAAGLVTVQEWRKESKTTESGYSSDPAVRHITDKLWEVLGLLDWIKDWRARMALKKGRRKAKAAIAQILAPAKAPVPAAVAKPAPAVRNGQPPPNRDGPRAVGDVALAEIAKMRKMLGL